MKEEHGAPGQRGARVPPEAAPRAARPRPPRLGRRRPTSTSTGTSTGWRCPRPVVTRSSPRCAATSPASRWTARGRCGRCGSSRASADGRIAVFSKMHHATVDGMSGMSLLAHLCSLEPEAPAPPSPSWSSTAARPGELEPAGPGRGAHGDAPAAAGQAARADRRRARPAPSDGPARARRWRRRSPRPRTLLQRHDLRPPVDRVRSTCDLDEVKAVKNATGSTVNDVVLTMCGGALRRYLDGRRRAARDVAAGHRAGLGARQSTRCPAPTRSRRCSPGWAPTSRTRSSG